MRKSLLLVLLVVLFIACGEKEEPERTGILELVATTGQVGDLLRKVGGERVKVTALMGPGIDPHLYKASAGDVERLRRADAVFYNGHHLEAKMGEVIEQMGASKPTMALAEVIDDSRLLSPSEFQGHFDPHVWFDLELWREAVLAAGAKLGELDPAHAAEYEARANAYASELDALHAYALEAFARVAEEQRVLITAHDAFGYFGRAYGLEVHGLQGISTATEAGTGDVQDLAAFIAERRIPALFVETSVSPRAIQAVREAVRSRGFEVEIGGEIFSDALGDADGPAGTFLGMFRHNVDTIVSSLLGEAGHGEH